MKSRSTKSMNGNCREFFKLIIFCDTYFLIIRAKNSRSDWLRHNFTSICPPLSEKFRKKVAILIGSPEPA